MNYDIPDNNAYVIKNTFLPNCENDYLSINAIINFLIHGFAQNHQIPEELQDYIFDTIEGKNPKWENYKNLDLSGGR